MTSLQHERCKTEKHQTKQHQRKQETKRQYRRNIPDIDNNYKRDATKGTIIPNAYLSSVSTIPLADQLHDERPPGKKKSTLISLKLKRFWVDIEKERCKRDFRSKLDISEEV